MFSKFRSFHWILIFPVLILYVNCDGYKSATSREISSQTCVNSAKHSLKLQNFEASADCFDLENIVCEKRSFRPNIPTATSKGEECLQSETWGDICVELTYLDFNTSEASSDPELYKSGASYNYQEYNCYIKNFKHHGKVIFHASHQHLSESLEDLYRSCLQGGE